MPARVAYTRVVARTGLNDAFHLHIDMTTILRLLAALCLAAALSASVTARAAEQARQGTANYPSKAIRIILPLSAGGSADAIARMVGETFANAFGQPVVVDNRPGASGIIGIDLAVKATPDGYTLLVASGANLTVNPALHGSKLPFDVERDLVPITHIASQTFVAHVAPAFPVKSIKELIAHAKAKPGVINYASAGTGSTAHLMAALFENMTGVKMTHVPYKGAPQGRTAVMAREVELMFDGLLASLPLMKSAGCAHSASPRRSARWWRPTSRQSPKRAFPATVPTRGTQSSRRAGHRPRSLRGFQRRSRKRWKRRMSREKLLAQGVEPAGGTPQQLRAFLKAEMEQWGKVVKEAGIRVE